MELWILSYMSSAHWALFIHTSNCNFHELKTSTKVVGLLVLSRALPQHITLSQLPKLSKYWNTVNTFTCKRWDFSSPLCLPLQTSCHRLAGITRLPGPLPPHHHYHQVLVVSIPGIIIVSCHENFDAYHIYFTSICEVYNASRNRSTNKSCTMKQMRLLSFLAIANTWKLWLWQDK